VAVQPQPRPKFRIALYPAERHKVELKPGVQSPDLDQDEIPFSVERVFFLLRWLVVGLGLAIQLYVVGSGSGGIVQLAHALQLTALMAVFTGTFGVLRYYYTDEQSRSWLAVMDAVAIAAVIGLDNGIYSPFQFLSYLIIAEAALVFSASNILSFTALVGVLYTGSVLLISGQKWSELTITIVLSQVVAMFIVASISGSMVRAIKQQRELARREQVLSGQLNYQVSALSALNRLSERLNASLNIEELMNSTMDTLPSALNVDACVGLLAGRNEKGQWQIGSVWYGIDEAFQPAENVPPDDEDELIQAGPLLLSQADLHTVLEKGQPLRLPLTLPLTGETAELNQIASETVSKAAVLIVPLQPSEGQGGLLALLRQSGSAFDQSDQELLAALGRQLSLLLNNARLYELERQNVARLQELEQMKSDFLSTVSHELRTPLTSIKASTILLLSQPDAEVSATELTLYKNIDRNTERLNALVTDLLDLTKLQNGRLRLAFQAVNLAEVVGEVVASMHPLTNGKQQTLEIRCDQALPPVLADRRRVEQIITNLVSNAHRYSPRGGQIVIELTKDEHELRIKVTDSGPGIAASEQTLVFEKFYRSQNQSSKSGTGLGLAIARSLVELHGGHIWVESQSGEGCSFYFTLPLGEGPNLKSLLD